MDVTFHTNTYSSRNWHGGRFLDCKVALAQAFREISPSQKHKLLDNLVSSETSQQSATMQPDNFSLNGSVHTGDLHHTFHPFRRLPAELRVEVWKFALPGPRIIKIVAMDMHLTMRKRIMRYSILPQSTYHRAIATPLLHTCQDSRAVALKIYEATLTTTSVGKESSLYFLESGHPLF